MPKAVKGYLAEDGSFFSTQGEALRHDARQGMVRLCDSHDIEADRFLVLVRMFAPVIGEYLNADAQCKDKECRTEIPEQSGGGGVPHIEEDQTNTVT